MLFRSADLPEDIHIVTDLAEFIQKHIGEWAEEIFVIGGGSIYAQLLPYCDKLFLTEVQATDKEADVFFPDFNRSEFTRESLGWGEDNGIKYEHVLYQRKRKE